MHFIIVRPSTIRSVVRSSTHSQFRFLVNCDKYFSFHARSPVTLSFYCYTRRRVHVLSQMWCNYYTHFCCLVLYQYNIHQILQRSTLICHLESLFYSNDCKARKKYLHLTLTIDIQDRFNPKMQFGKGFAWASSCLMSRLHSPVKPGLCASFRGAAGADLSSTAADHRIREPFWLVSRSNYLLPQHCQVHH